MPVYLLLTVLLAAAPTSPASEQCDAKPFTLTKPVKAQAPAKQKAEPGPKASATVAASKAEPAKPKPKPLADCDQPKKKG